ncbi:MAG: amidase family protein [Eubacteriales bacterium]|nr:amidase family protein [Eubacteriales bacterium]
MDELCKMTAFKLRDGIQKRKIGIEKLTRALDAQKSQRDSLLFGLPVLIKDNLDVSGLHTTAGSLSLSDNRAKTNAALVENIVQRGGIVLGKTNMAEFANFTTQGMPGGYSSSGGFVKKCL